ncbi:MAG TPA: hypothetical protein VH165_02570 [Kofleriaceae bacterium]|nr:hypothetical protein [Kofleriaceae bacterium]
MISLSSSALFTVLALGAAACTTAGAAADPSSTDPAPSASDEAPQLATLPSAGAAPSVVATPATVTGTLNCNLEYERFSPSFATSPILSFSKLMTTVAASGASVTNATYQLYAAVNSAPATNLAFQVGVNLISTGQGIVYLVLPSPTLGGAYLFENGAHITAVTVGGVAYDYLRVYCSLTP